MLFGIVVVVAIAGDTAKYHPLIIMVPFIDRQHQEFFPDSPGIRKRGDKGGVDHIPGFPVVLHFFRNYAINVRHALSYSIAAKLSKDIRHWDFGFFTGHFDIAHNLIDHELVVVFKPQGVLDREPAADID